MNKINNLIKRLCSNSIEYMCLDNIVSIETGKLNANAMVENGKYVFFTCDAKPFKIDTYAFDGEAILISGNGSQVGHLNYYVGKFNAYQRTYVLMNFNKNIISKYLFHYLNAYLKKYIDENSKRGSIPYITLPMLQKFKVAIPPVEIQEEIIKILDEFDELISELNLELEQRKKQYEFCRKKLFNITKVKYKTIKELCTDIIVPMRDKPKIFDGSIPWCRIEDKEGNYFNTSKSGQFVSEDTIKMMNLKVFPTGTVICSCSASIGSYAINTRPLITNQTFIGLVCGNEIINKYLFYFMQTQTEHLLELSNSGTIPYVSRKKFEDLEVPVPSIKEQEKIVSILDKFDEFINDISVGLPAEIKLRRKQCEYYRNKLLSFEGINEKM